MTDPDSGVPPLAPPPSSVERELAAVTTIVRALLDVPEGSRRKVLATVEAMVPISEPPKRRRAPKVRPPVST